MQKSRIPTDIDPGFFFGVSIQLLRIAKIILADSTSAAVFAKIPCGLDQFFKIFGIGFDISFFL